MENLQTEKNELTLEDAIERLNKVNSYHKTSSINIEKRFNEFLPYVFMYCDFVADCKKIARNKHEEKKLVQKTLEKVMNDKVENSYKAFKDIHCSEKTAIDTIAENSDKFKTLLNERKSETKKRMPSKFRGIVNLDTTKKEEKTFNEIVKSFTERNIKKVVGQVEFQTDFEKNKFFLNEFMKSFTSQFQLKIIDNQNKENKEIAEDIKKLGLV